MLCGLILLVDRLQDEFTMKRNGDLRCDERKLKCLVIQKLDLLTAKFSKQPKVRNLFPSFLIFVLSPRPKDHLPILHSPGF